MIEGSSTNAAAVGTVEEIARGHSSVRVILDSNHTHDYALMELRSSVPFVTSGSYCVVFDACIENLPESASSNRYWTNESSPMSATRQFLQEKIEFDIDESIDAKLQITEAPSGFLWRRD